MITPIEKIKELLDGLVEKSSLPFTKTNLELNPDDGAYWCRIETNDPRYLLGREGEVLHALNILSRRLVEEHKDIPDPRPIIVVEVNDFQKKRIENLKTLAHMLSERAKYFKSSIDVEPMSAYERKIIHTFLQDNPSVKTESVGEGRGRHIVIRYVGS